MVLDPKINPVVSAEEAFKALGIDRGTGYNAIRNNTFPLPIIRVGRIIRIPTVSLCRMLQMSEEEEKPSKPDTENRTEELNKSRIIFQFIQIESL